MEPIQFGNFTLLERISHGGMAEVFRAKSFGEAGFEREVALKVLLPSIASDQEFVNMLIDEAKIAGQLNHANIAQIFDLGVADDRYFIVQEFVNGKDLRAILKHKLKKKTHLDVPKACYIALKVCEGLFYAHNKEDVNGRPLNLVHRDISPHNILISNEGEVKIIDFGIAKAEGRATQTMAGLVKGKFAYMSPEQIRGLPVDHRSDIFATGIVLHEMLTTRPLFSRASEFETLKRARSAIAEPPSESNPLVPKTLDAIVLKALARHVDDRYQTAQEFRDALWSFAREHDAFVLDETTGSGKSLTPSGSESSIEIEIASEVRDLRELEHPSAPPESSVPDAGESAYEITIEGSEATELAPPALVQALQTPPEGNPKASSSSSDDYEEDEENMTMVDPGLPFGVPGMGSRLEDELGSEQTGSEFTPTDHDAKWAASALSPYGSAASPKAAPARSTQSPLGVTLDDESTSHRDSPSSDAKEATSTRSIPSRRATANMQSASDRRVTTPAMAIQNPAANLSASDRRVTTPAMAIQNPAVNVSGVAPPLDESGSTLQHSSFDEQTLIEPGNFVPGDQEWNPATPTTTKAAQTQAGPAPQANPSPQAAAPGASQRVMSTHLGVEAPPVMPSRHTPPGPNPALSPAHVSNEFDEPTGAAPLQMPTPAPTPIYGGPRPTSQGAVVAPRDSTPSGRLYLLMLAVFFLIMAIAATITMVITE